MVLITHNSIFGHLQHYIGLDDIVNTVKMDTCYLHRVPELEGERQDFSERERKDNCPRFTYTPVLGGIHGWENTFG